MSNSDPRSRNKAALPTVSRRRLLKTGAGALPAVMTLQSGAAFARSSNVLGASTMDVTDPLGRTMCIDLASVVPIDDYSRIYDLGHPPSAVVNVIRGEEEGRLYYVNRRDRRDGRPAVHPGLMCERGGQFWFKPVGRRWQSVEIPKGFVASSGAIHSFATEIHQNLV